MIVRGTTPTVRINFSAVDTANIAVAYLTIKQNGMELISKDLSEATVEEGYLAWNLTQEETLSMSSRCDITIQCRYRLNDGNAYATKIFTDRPYDVTREGVI